MENEQSSNPADLQIQPLKHPKLARLGNKAHTWKKGETGNPKGRPRTQDWNKIIENALNESKVPGGPTVKEIITKKLLQMAKNGNLKAVNEVLNRNIGRPKEFVDHTTNGESLNITVNRTLLERPAEIKPTQETDASDN